MWNRKKIKKDCKHNLKKNYWNKIFVCILTLLIVGNYSYTKQSLSSGKDLLEKYFPTIKKIDINIDKENPDLAKETNTTNGTFKFIFDKTSNVISTTQVYLGNAFKAVENVTNQKGIADFIKILFALLIGVVFKVFILNVISVGENRFFLETRKYKKTKFTRIFSNFKKGKYLNTVKTMFIKNIYLSFWYLTIVGGIIKNYSYRMVQFIIAENPNIKTKDAINLSRKMMNGNKWKMFLLDISYIGYIILNALTFGLIGILFLNPYMKSVETEIYTKFREQEKNDLLNDKDLYIENEGTYFPGTKKEEIKIDYYRKYNLSSFIMFFFSFSIVGWLWEVLLYIIKEGKFVNRGTLYGPWLPIYGAGCVFVLLLLIPKKFKKITDNPISTFFIIMIICGVIEYFSGWACEYFKCARYWDYSGYFLNIKGRICLECTMFFGLGGTACIYLIAPKLDRIFKKISKKNTFVLCTILVTLFSIDWLYSSKNPNMGAGITDENNMAPPITSNYCKNKNA